MYLKQIYKQDGMKQLMIYNQRKKQLLESVIKEKDIMFSDLISSNGNSILSKEEAKDDLEDEAEKLIAEVLKKIKINGRRFKV